MLVEQIVDNKHISVDNYRTYPQFSTKELLSQLFHSFAHNLSTAYPRHTHRSKIVIVSISTYAFRYAIHDDCYR